MELNIGLRRWYRYWRSAEYRKKIGEYAALRKLPRYQKAISHLLGAPLEILDASSFLGMYEEIFERQVFRFETELGHPYIIDAGANIGMATIYFKRLYPGSRVIAFEPDPEAFAAFERNVRAFALRGVELLPVGLWSSKGLVGFMHEGADGSRIAQGNDRVDITVPTVRLRDYLDRPVQFLKLDIEGAEAEVLADSRDLLHRVERLFVEYHSFAAERQRLHEVLRIINEAGFRVHLNVWAPPSQPFLHRPCNLGLDLQVNIFGDRPSGTERRQPAQVDAAVRATDEIPTPASL